MSAAGGCRIGKITLKSGGELRLLRRRDANSVVQHMREFFTLEMNNPAPPDAYAAVTLKYDPKTPGLPIYNVTYCSQHDALPPSVVCRTAGLLIAEAAVEFRAENRVMKNLGVDTDPDAAS